MVPRFGLRVYLAVAFAVIVAATGAAFSVLTGREVMHALQQRIGLILERGATEAQDNIDRELRERQDDMSNYAVVVRDAGATDLGDIVRIGVASLTREERDFGCDWASAADTGGRVVATSAKGPRLGTTLFDPRQLDVVRRGPATLEQSDGAPSGPAAPRLLLARPLLDRQAQPFAFLACDLEPAWSARLSERAAAGLPGTADTELIVVDATGRVVLESPGVPGGALPDGLRTLANTPGPAWLQFDWPGAGAYFVATAGKPLQGPLAQLGWSVMVRRTVELAMKPAVETRDRIYELSAAIAFLAAILGAAAAHRILLPLRAIADATRRIGGGELGVHIPEFHSYREIETLSRSLHTMLATLRGNEARLAALNESLDQRVRQRTAEIAEAHEALAQQESRLRAVIDTAMDGVLIIGQDNRIQIFNKACERMFGWRSEEIVGRLSSELVSAETRSLRSNQMAFDDLVGPMAAGELAIEQVRTIRGRRRDGTTFPLEVSLSRTSIQGGSVYVAILRDVTEAVRARQELFALATKDALTGLRNRRYFLEGADTEFARSRRHSRGFALLLIDADHFKQVNDTRGHAAGDRALQGIADICNRSLREVDLVGRLGGEEFAVAMPEADLVVACQVAERLRQQIAEHDMGGGDQSFHVTVSIGVAAASQADRTLDQMLRRADQALYAAKNSGRNRVSVAAPVLTEDSL